MQPKISSGDQRAGKTVTEHARRAQIVDGAIDAIAELGFAKASFVEIARRAGLRGTGLISYHFANKNDLIDSVVDEIIEVAKAVIVPFMQRHDDARGKVLGFVEGSIELYSTRTKHMLVLRAIYNNHLGDLGRSELMTWTDVNEITEMEALLAEAQQAGAFRPFATRPMAMTIRMMLNGALEQLVIDPDTDLSAYGAELIELIDRATRAD